MKSGSITWKRQHQSSTLNLVIVFSLLTKSLISYVTNIEWQYSSDHRPIITEIMLSIPEEKTQIHQCWKKADGKKIQQIVIKILLIIINMLLDTNKQIDTVVDALIKLI